MLNKPNWNEWCDKEFIYAMQAKGKLPKPENHAKDVKEKTYYDTVDRIFPARDAEDRIVEKLLSEAEKKVATMKPAPPRERPDRRELKARLHHMEAMVNLEKQARQRAEEELNSLQSGQQ